MKNFESRPRNSVRERKLAQELRQQPEETRFQFIQELLKKDDEVGLVFANACLRKKSYFEAILEQALETHWRNLRPWLKCVIPRLGFRRVVSRVTEKLESHPETVNRALYELCVLLPKHDQRAVQALIELSELMESKGLLRKPAVVPRRTLFSRRVILRTVERMDRSLGSRLETFRSLLEE